MCHTKTEQRRDLNRIKGSNEVLVFTDKVKVGNADIRSVVLPSFPILVKDILFRDYNVNGQLI